MVTLPLYVFPAMVNWRTDRVEGPIDEYINNPKASSSTCTTGPRSKADLIHRMLRPG